MSSVNTHNAFSRTSDRLVWTLLVATAIHAIIILQTTFNPLDSANNEANPLPTLDITLVNTAEQHSPPEKADYLAEASQDGGGNTDERVLPQEAQVAETIAAASPVKTRQSIQVVARHKKAKQALPSEPTPEDPATEISASELIDRSLEMLSLNQQINQSRKVYSDRPRQKNITSRTRELKYAAYMQGWVAKVEQVGALNYPDTAKRQHLSGSLLVDVGILADGSIKDIRVVKPSGHKILDDAAIRIVKLAAPYAVFPENIREDFDELHIIRTWVFSSDQLKGR
ncbi:MAG: TonB family protein [Gammaproteobacteria bacterium]